MASKYETPSHKLENRCERPIHLKPENIAENFYKDLKNEELHHVCVSKT